LTGVTILGIKYKEELSMVSSLSERYMIEMSVELDIQALLGENSPIVIRSKLEKKYPMLARQEIIEVLNEYQYMMLASRHCKAVGHDMRVQEHSSPETGGASWHCERCGIGGEHTYY
jgi:hypothetical protein